MGNDFKTLFMLDPEVTYFNHGAYGGCPEYILSAIIITNAINKYPKPLSFSIIYIVEINHIEFFR